MGEFEIPQINSRESVVVTLDGWTVPTDADSDSKVYVVVDEGNEITEVHEDNNIGWALVNPNFGTSTSIDGEDVAGLPGQLSLDQNYPNPFNPSTTIQYRVPVAQDVSLRVFDILGRQVVELVNQKQPAGEYRVEFDASELSSGIYLYRLTGDSWSETKRMLLVK